MHAAPCLSFDDDRHCHWLNAARNAIFVVIAKYAIGFAVGNGLTVRRSDTEYGIGIHSIAFS